MSKKVVAVCVLVAVLAIVCSMWFIVDDFDPATLRNKVILITGASTGIGEQLAYQYASAGAALLLTARRQNVLLQVASKCRQLGSPRVEIVDGDMGDADHRVEVVKRTRQLFGRLDHLVLNHALYEVGFWDNIDAKMAELERILRVNVVAYADLATRSLDLLNWSGGSVAVLSSTAGHIGFPTILAYSASKFALEGFFASLRHELSFQKSNVTITVCVLGLVATQNVLDKARDKYGTEVEVVQSVAARPADAATAILKSVALKKSVMYYPLSAYWLVTGNFLFPSLVEAFTVNELNARFGLQIGV